MNASIEDGLGRKKVVIVINELLRGGAQRIVSDLARGIDYERFVVTVVYLKSHKNFAPDTPTLETELHDAGIRVVSMEGARRFSFFDLVKLMRFLRVERPDIVHTFLPYAGTIGRIAARLAGVLYIVSTQCNVRVAYDARGFWIDTVTLRLASAWTAASEGIECEYGGSAAAFDERLWRARRRHFTIWAGVDLPAFDERIARSDKDSVRDQLEIKRNVPILMMVARLVPWKGHADVIAALEFLPADIHVVFIGWGKEEERLRACVQALGATDRVHFLGVRNDVPELLKTADVYVQAHNYAQNGEIWKGPNASQMEACAAEVPSVSTAVPLIESLIEDEVTGLIARPNDPADLARAILALLADRKKARVFAKCARERVEERFSTVSMVRAYTSLYESLLLER